MKRLRIAVYPGDGIGPEVTAQAVRVLRAVEKGQIQWSLDLTEFPWGAAFFRQTGQVVPDNYLDVLRPFDRDLARLLNGLGPPNCRTILDARSAGDTATLQLTINTLAYVRRSYCPACAACWPAKGQTMSTWSWCARTPRENMSITADAYAVARPTSMRCKPRSTRGRRDRADSPGSGFGAGPHAPPATDDDYQEQRAASCVRVVG